MLLFVLIVVGALVVLVLWSMAVEVGGSGNDILGLNSPREISERKSALEAEDLDQMLAAHNRRRVARGLEALSADDMEMQVMSDINRERAKAREALEAQRRKTGEDEQELEELLEATNARRRAKGLPERTRADVEREFGRE